MRIGMPSDGLPVDASVSNQAGTWRADTRSFVRTARRLFDGRIWLSTFR